MVCYVPGTSTLAVLGFAVYLVWHRAIMHFLDMVGMAMEVTLLLSTEVVVAIFLIWTARMIRRRRAAAGACTTCRFRCQEALASRPNFFVNRVDRRVSPPPARRPALTCHPAAPILPALPALPRLAGRRAPGLHAAVPSAVPAPRQRGAALPGPRLVPGLNARRLPLFSWRHAQLFSWRRDPLLSWQGIPLHGSRHALTRPAVAGLSPGAPPRPGLPAPARPAPARPAPAEAAADQWSLAPGETVAFDGYVLTPDGVDAPADPVRDPHS